VISDFRQAFRTLLKSPGFSALVVVVLAVGIGANTAIFSIVNGVLLKPLPFAHADRLVSVETTIRNQPDNTSYPDYLDWRAQATSFDALAVWTGNGSTLTGFGDAKGLPSAVVSPELLSMLGVPPLRGRVFTADDDKPGAQRTVVIAESLWNKTFSRDEHTVGRSITLDGDPFLVIGIMPASFEFPFDAEDPAQIWIPVRASRFAANWAEQRNASFLHGLGRLKAGATITSAQADLSTIAGRLAEQYPRNKSRGVLVRPYQDVLVKDYRLGMIVLLSAVAAVLLIACANIANLLLARGSTRRREIAVRTALGASRGRIARQLFAESLILAVTGGALSLLLALWVVRLLVALSPLQIPRLHGVHVDLGALLFAAAISIGAGLISGLVPALQLSRANLAESLKDGDRGGSVSAGARTRQALVVAEMAISLVLLAAAGLLVRSLVSLQSVNPGFVTERALSIQLQLPGTRYPTPDAMRAFYHRLRDELRAIPGASATAIATTMPMSGSDIGVGFTIDGRPTDPTVRLSASYFGISPEYFSTMGIPVLKGRGFTERDSAQAPDVVIINETLAAKYWPNENAIGKRMTIGYDKTGPREVVGIVGTVKRGTLADTAEPQMYTPFDQTPWPFLAAVVRTSASPESAAGSLRTVMSRIDPLEGAAEIKTLEEYVAKTVATPRFTAYLVGAFATFAVLLAGFGLFSVMAYSVSQRRREIGIRMALGAQASDVRGMVVSQAVKTGLIGLAIGLAGALAAARVLETLLYGVRPHDPVTFAAVSLLLLAVMLVAAYLPARRATRVDPMTALRTE
jgi:putative ABC transport system permease protein